MSRFSCLLLLVLTPTAARSSEPTFQEILERVQNREPRTGAIMTIRTTADEQDQGSPDIYSDFEIRIEDKTAHVAMWNNYLTGKKGVSFTFPVTPKVEAEYKRLKNLDRLRELDAAVADAERRRRIFVLSSFQLEAGSKREEVEAVFGKPASVMPWMKAGWTTLAFSDVSVIIALDKVHDIRSRSSD